MAVEGVDNGICFLRLNKLNVEQEVTNVTILNQVAFAFDSQFSVLLDRDLGFMLDQIIQSIHFNANKSAFKIGMNHAGSCLLYTSPSPRDKRQSRMPSSA